MMALLHCYHHPLSLCVGGWTGGPSAFGVLLVMGVIVSVVFLCVVDRLD